MLTFLQLSDIHFRGGDLVDGHGDPLDYDFRERLIADARQTIRELGGASGVLICGDIANKGAGSEFGQAAEWLQNLCAAINVDPWLVWVVPGNHDIDRAKIGDRQIHLRAELRECASADLDSTFERILADPNDSESLLEPLYNYLEFATAFNCAFDSDPSWTERVEFATDGSLELRGINSALLCGSGDNRKTAPMVIGDRQATVEVADGIVHYTLCHHPHSWLRDGVHVDELFDQRVHVRVTGHLHNRDLRPSTRGVHLEAGAVSPEPDEAGGFTEPCIPRYELISLRTAAIDDELHLDLVIRGRLWDQEQGWRADQSPNGLFARRYHLGASDAAVPIDVGPIGLAAVITRPLLELRYRLARLPSYDRVQCAQKIGAPLEDILGAQAHRQVDQIFSWAEENNRLARLWDEVMTQIQTPESRPNPFES